MGCTIGQTAMLDTKQFMIKNYSLWINCSFHIYLILFYDIYCIKLYCGSVQLISSAVKPN